MHTTPNLTNIWTSNFGLQKLNENGYFVVNDNITKNVREMAAEIQVLKYKNSKQGIENEQKTIRVHLERDKVSSDF